MKRIGEIKKRKGLPVRDPVREREKIDSAVKRASELGIPPAMAEDLMKRIIEWARRIEGDRGSRS